MTLQDWYYSLAIAQMVVGITLMFFAAFIMWKIYVTIREAPKQLSNIATSIIQRNKNELFSMAAMTALPLIVGRFKGWFSRK